jgi:Anti-sigma-K factor rskA/Putative zinc-finger
VNSQEHQRYEDELAAYMLGALEPEEERVYVAHLAGCEHCQARERWLRASVELLPSSVEQHEAPPALRERLMDVVRQEAGVPHEAARPQPASRGLLDRLRARLDAASLRPAAALTAVVLLLAAGIAGYAVRGGGEGSGTATIPATGTAAEPQTKGTVIRDGDRGILRVANLPQRKGRVYEVWLVQNGKPVPATLFQVVRNGTGAAAIPSGLDRSTQVMVTSEPPGGSDQPTTQPLLSARV